MTVNISLYQQHVCKQADNVGSAGDYHLSIHPALSVYYSGPIDACTHSWCLVTFKISLFFCISSSINYYMQE